MENIQNNYDDFIINWLPNCEDMLNKTLKNVNLAYYPFSASESKYKVFDFTPQRGIIDGDDEFIEIDQKASATSAKQKTKTQTRTQNVPTKKPTQATKAAQSQQSKLKVTQTIAIKPDWKVIASFNKQSLEKLKIDTEVEVEDKLFCGKLLKISDDYQKDTINPLNPVSLQRYDNFKFFGNISTLEDEKIKSATEIANVFITDKILSVMMTCVFNSRPWHLKITKIGESIFIDKMPNSEIDLVTVNESSDNMPPDDDDKNIDSFKNLAIEATLINEFVKEQVIDPEYPYDEEIEVNVEPHPFAEEGDKDVERLTYRYRLWKMGDIDVLVRCQVHSFDVNEKGENIFVNVFALNEFDVRFNLINF
jgi:hypothetical protein